MSLLEAAASPRINLNFPVVMKIGVVWSPRLGCHMKQHLRKFESLKQLGLYPQWGGVTFSRALGGEQWYINSVCYSPQLLGGPVHDSHVPRVQ